MKKVIFPLLIITIFTGLYFIFTEKSSEGDHENTSLNQGLEINTIKESMTIVAPTGRAVPFEGALLKTSNGDITIAFYNNSSPKTVENFVNLAQAGFYDNTKFHRVIHNFMIQGGDPLSKDDTAQSRWGSGGPEYRFEDEINEHSLVRGSLAMANAGPDTNGSQFFIVTAKETPWLDGKHTNFGEVVHGMDVVEAIESTATAPGDRPLEPVVLESIELISKIRE